MSFVLSVRLRQSNEAMALTEEKVEGVNDADAAENRSSQLQPRKLIGWDSIDYRQKSTRRRGELLKVRIPSWPSTGELPIASLLPSLALRCSHNFPLSHTSQSFEVNGLSDRKSPDRSEK